MTASFRAANWICKSFLVILVAGVAYLKAQSGQNYLNEKIHNYISGTLLCCFVD